MKKMIKSSVPRTVIILIVILVALPLVFLFSPYFDWKMGMGGVTIFLFASAVFLLVDSSNSTILYDDQSVQFKGFFGVRKKAYLWQNFRGYRLRQKADQASGFHDEIQLILKNGKKIGIPKVAYKEAYNQVYDMCKSNLNYLEYKQLKNGSAIAWTIRIAFLLSGIMALLVGLKKLI